ncbi:MAG: pknB 9 [Myxococcales bacterium]|nr:pknB 9 [Myxococcales bacterium]
MTKSTTDVRSSVRIGRALASPVGVLVTVPLLVVAVGVGVLLVGRDATRSASQAMARRELSDQAASVQADVAFALDQAEPLIGRVRVLADEQRPLEDVLRRLHDLLVGRPGVAYLSISFPDGTFRGAYLTPEGGIEAQESTLAEHYVRRFSIEGEQLVPVRTEPNQYDPRTREFYRLAASTGARAWTEPYTFFKSHETGITCTEPVYDEAHALRAVITVDFHVGALSRFIAKPALDEARSFVFKRDGTILASSAAQLATPAGGQLLRSTDVHDPALDAVLAEQLTDDVRELDTRDGAYLARVTPIGGKRAGVTVPLDWFVATVVPTRTLLGPTHALERSSIIASGGALAIALSLALVLAWNLVRMRKQVAASREQARTAEARARELGSYRLVSKLGTGGMGEVWRAEHRLLAREAAIKLIRPEVLDDPKSVADVRERFRREAQTLASMKSRHTIAIFDFGVTVEGIFYYVMELLDGLDLESLVARYGAQPAGRVIELLAQACASLAEAHDAGLLHRDIKPPNLFVCRAADELDITKLLDFGIVQTVNEKPAQSTASTALPETPKLTRVGAMLGTPGFMAPEQILGMQLDGRADLYALGCVGWWLLAGREVFPRDGSEAKFLQRHLYEAVPPLRDHVTGWLPAELEAVIASCLAKDLDERPADARALAARLRTIEIPEDQRWTEERALAWWQAYSPPVHASKGPSAEIRIVMPNRTADELPGTAERSVAKTIID